MRKKYIVIAAVITIVIFLFSLIQKSLSFPPKGIGCFNQFINGMESDRYKPPSFKLENVYHFRCASERGYFQYEIEGIDNNGDSFYVHVAAGGMAASGFDSHFDACYKKNGVVIESEKLVGPGNKLETGSCRFTEGFPEKPTSVYGYTSQR